MIRRNRIFDLRLKVSFQIIQVREMYEMFLCHTCKSDYSTILATFDFFLLRGNHGEHVSFRGQMEIVCEAQNNNRMVIFQIHVDINAVSIQWRIQGFPDGEP